MAGTGFGGGGGFGGGAPAVQDTQLGGGFGAPNGGMAQGNGLPPSFNMNMGFGPLNSPPQQMPPNVMQPQQPPMGMPGMERPPMQRPMGPPPSQRAYGVDQVMPRQSPLGGMMQRFTQPLSIWRGR